MYLLGRKVGCRYPTRAIVLLEAGHRDVDPQGRGTDKDEQCRYAQSGHCPQYGLQLTIHALSLIRVRMPGPFPRGDRCCLFPPVAGAWYRPSATVEAIYWSSSLRWTELPQRLQLRLLHDAQWPLGRPPGCRASSLSKTHQSLGTVGSFGWATQLYVPMAPWTPPEEESLCTVWATYGARGGNDTPRRRCPPVLAVHEKSLVEPCKPDSA